MNSNTILVKPMKYESECKTYTVHGFAASYNQTTMVGPTLAAAVGLIVLKYGFVLGVQIVEV